MTDMQFKICITEASNYADRDAFISDLALSSMWGEDTEITEEFLAKLAAIWDTYHRTIPQIAADAGMSCRKLAERFCIPYRTVENWSAGTREAPVYVRLMMQECLGLIKR